MIYSALRVRSASIIQLFIRSVQPPSKQDFPELQADYENYTVSRNIPQDWHESLKMANKLRTSYETRVILGPSLDSLTISGTTLCHTIVNYKPIFNSSFQ